MNPLRLAAFAIAGLLAAPAWGTLQAPTISLAPASIVGAGTSTLTITLDNNPPGNPSNIAFNFVYPANVFNAAAPAASTTCLGGTVSAPALGNSLSLSGASISGNNICTVTVTLRSCNQAVYSIGGFSVTSTSGNPTAGSANLTVTSNSAALAGTSTVSASPGSVPADGTSASTITVTAINACGTGAPNKSISLGQGAGSSTITPVSQATNASGVANFSVTNSVAETVTYTATDTTDSVVITQTAQVTFTAVIAPVSSFNVVEPGANAVTGRIFTKIAGENIAVDIVALDVSNNVATTFTGDVTVELVDSCAAGTPVKTLAVQTFTPGDNGRHALSAGQFVADAHRNLRFRIKYPVASPTVTACSGDAFANRPKQFVGVVAQDQDRTSAGVARTLNNTANPGIGPGAVHNAGRPFRLDATAQNSAVAPATTINYVPDAGQPVAVLSQCGVAAVCPAALVTLSTGAWSATNGVITSVSASYGDVGAFDLLLEDRTFASVDAGDGTADAVRYIRSDALLTVGRFVPDHFTILPAATPITPRTDIAGCSASTFTYLEERMDLAFTLTAHEAGGAVTQGYSGAVLGALALNASGSYGFGAIDTAAPTPLTARVDGSLIPSEVSATWSAGTTGVITAPISIRRAAAPDGPYGALRIGAAPTDSDGVALRTADLNLDADNDATPERRQIGAATAVRFGRLRMQSAYGPGTVPLPMLLELQHWNGTAFVHNTDDSCTTLAAADIALSGHTLNLGPGETSIVEAMIAFNAGSGKLTLSAPGAANNGSVLLTPALAAARSYLQGKWTGAAWNENPSARATFGLYGSQPKNFIFFRENY